jgi:beta-barrel assembly-enhancing protease
MHFFISLILLFSTAAYSEDFRFRASHLASGYTEKDIETEVEFGRSLAAKILGRYKMVPNDKLANYISLMGEGLAVQVGRPELNFYFAVLDTDEINAYACPGGYIFITKGAIGKMTDEAQLAGVIAHEIAHINQRHVVKQLNIKSSDGSLSAGVASLVGGSTASGKVALEQVMERAMKILFEEGINKKDELESDALAVEMSNSLGYDWKSYKNYLHRISGHIEQMHVLSKTHPTITDRISELDRVAAKNNFMDIEGKKNEKRFKEYAGI